MFIKITKLLSAFLLLYSCSCYLYYGTVYEKATGSHYSLAVANAINRAALLGFDKKQELRVNFNNHEFCDVSNNELYYNRTPALYNDCIVAGALDMRGWCNFWWLGRKCAVIIIPDDIFEARRSVIEYATASPCEFLPEIRSARTATGLEYVLDIEVLTDSFVLKCEDNSARQHVSVVLKVAGRREADALLARSR